MRPLRSRIAKVNRIHQQPGGVLMNAGTGTGRGRLAYLALVSSVMSDVSIEPLFEGILHL